MAIDEIYPSLPEGRSVILRLPSTPVGRRFSEISLTTHLPHGHRRPWGRHRANRGRGLLLTVGDCYVTPCPTGRFQMHEVPAGIEPDGPFWHNPNLPGCSLSRVKSHIERGRSSTYCGPDQRSAFQKPVRPLRRGYLLGIVASPTPRKRSTCDFTQVVIVFPSRYHSKRSFLL
jgi:hypothetical protein